MLKRYGVRIGAVLCILILASYSCHESLRPSPPGYDLNAPRKFILSAALHEISGIAFLKGNSDTLYAIEDEDGKLFFWHPGAEQYEHVKFGKKGDFEDVAILKDQHVVVLRSDGSLFVFPIGAIGGGIKDAVQEYENILPAGEYEGLFGDDDGKLIALCKNCPDDDQRKEVSVYVLEQDAGGKLGITRHVKVDLSGEHLTSINRKVKFHPSCIARHPITHEWYIISSVNKVLLILDEQWKVKADYALNPYLFKQPEGLAFDKKGNMYISNEGDGGNANVLLFDYKRLK